MQPGYPGQDPYGQQPQYGQDPTYGQSPPYGQQPPQPPQYGQPPTSGSPYGQPTSGSPYGQPTSGQPYGQPTSGQPYGQPTSGQPYGQPTPDPYAQPYPAAPAYPASGYGAPTGNQNTQGLLAMIFGIVSLPLAICCALLGLGLGVTAVILGFMGKNKAEQGLASNRGQAMAGLICGAIGAVLAIGNFILGLVLNFGTFGTNF